MINITAKTMNRERKYRSWSESKRSFLYWTLRDLIVSRFTVGGDSDSRLPYDEYAVVQEWTGLTDIYGKDVYEGDFLNNEYQRPLCYFKVYWNNQSAKFNTLVYYTGKKLTPQKTIPIEKSIEFEVVGNMLETPQLVQ